ncbi:hypothetical protein Sazerac_019 [Staphylococcus phage Sazerac]|nr:hypothetical protein Sazerac_019 [Staphylococcus phage Sazerac]
MDIDIKKNGKVRVLDTPYFKPITQTNISFSNMDIGTAKITFELLKNSLPLQVSEKNVDVYSYLESKNGSSIEVPLHFEDPLNGIVSMTIDKDFLEASTNSTVEGQLYITMNKKNKTYNDYSNTVALQKFSFAVEDALINKISGSDKIFYIRSFDILKSEIKNKIYEMEQDIGKIEQVKKELETLFYEVKEEINQIRKDTINQLQSEYTEYSELLNDIHNQALTDIDNRTKVSLNQIDNRKEEVLQLLEEGEIVTKTMFEEYKSDIKDQLDEALLKNQNEIKSYKDDLQSTIDNLNWQKHKLTTDEGNIISISDTVDMNTLGRLDKTGFYYCSNITNAPDGESTTGYINVYNQSSTLGFAYFINQDGQTIYTNTKNNGTWGSWQSISKDQIKDLNWQKYKITEDDGSRQWLGTLDKPVEKLSAGSYECTIPSNAGVVNAPSDVNGSAYLAEIDVTVGANGRKQIFLIQNYTKDIWLKTIHTNGADRGWVLVNRDYEKDLDWQKYKMVDDNGKNYTVDCKNNGTTLHNLAPKHYYLTNVPDLPSGVGKDGMALVISDNTDKNGRIIYSPQSSSDVYMKNKVMGNWSPFVKVTTNYSSTGWQDLPLTNGIQEYSSSYKPQFKLVEMNDMIMFSLRGAIKNVTSSRQMFAQIPPYILRKLVPPHPYVQSGSVKNGEATFIRLSIERNGEVGIIAFSKPNEMSASDFYPIDTTIVI